MNNEIKFLPPFKRMCMTIGTLPSSFYASMSYYESMVWLYEYLKNEVIPVVNNNSEVSKELQDAFTELESYIEHYFENLDIQHEVDVKLDEMALDGTLADMIAEYIKMQGQLVYNSVAEMKSAENIQNGSFLKTYGFHSYNDGGGAFYKARTVTNEDVIDEIFIISLHDNTLVAELIIDNEISVEQTGAYGDGEHNDTLAINKAVNSGAKVVSFSKNEYLVNNRIEIIEKNDISIKGNGAEIVVDESVAESETPNYDHYLIKGYKCNNINIEDLNVDGSKTFYYRTDDTSEQYAENTAAYLAHRSTGYSGINFESSDNITIKNCIVHHTGSGIGFKNSKNSIIENCQVLYTLTDAYPIYYGNENISVKNCYCENNGDDAFPVFSLKKYWNYENEEVDVARNENIHFMDCRSVNNRARGLINEGGNNIFYENCVFDNVNWCFYIGTYNTETEYSTDNTFINNCVFNTAEQDGITSAYRATVEKANNVYFTNCNMTSTETIGAHQQLRFGTDTNLYMTDTNLKDIKFVNLTNTSQKARLVNVIADSTSYSEFDINTIELENCTFKNAYDGNQGIYFNACSNISAMNVTLNSGKYLIGSFTNINTDNIFNFYSNSLSGATIKISSPIMTKTAVTNGTYADGSVQIVKGIPRYYDTNAWKIPLFLPVSDVIGGGTSLNTLYGIDGVKVNICTTGATDRPPDNEMFFIITMESSGANVKSQMAISISNSSLLYTRNGTGSWVSH